MRAILLFLVGSIVIAGCQSAPVNLHNVKEGNWHARALIKDKEHSRTFIVNLDFNAVRDRSLRVDVTSTLGQFVAALVLNHGEVKYLTADNKRLYVGAPKPDVLRPILAIPLDPRWLLSVLFDEAITADNWTCENDKDRLVAKCHEEGTELSIVWSNRKGAGRTIQITHPKAEMQINFRSFSAKLENVGFDIKLPEGYTQQRVH
jgi:hypothetical protein